MICCIQPRKGAHCRKSIAIKIYFGGCMAIIFQTVAVKRSESVAFQTQTGNWAANIRHLSVSHRCACVKLSTKRERALTCCFLWLSPPPSPFPTFFHRKTTPHHPPEPDPNRDTIRNSHPFAKTTPGKNDPLLLVSARNLTCFKAEFGKEFSSRTLWKGPSWNCPSPSSVLCHSLYRKEHFWGGGKRAKRCREQGRKRGGQQRAQKDKQDAWKQVRNGKENQNRFGGW